VNFHRRINNLAADLVVFRPQRLSASSAVKRILRAAKEFVG
jgi:hypothetical protein